MNSAPNVLQLYRILTVIAACCLLYQCVTLINFYSTIQISSNISSWKSLTPFSLTLSSKNSTFSHVSQDQTLTLPHCPSIPPGLVGPIQVALKAPSFDEIEALNPSLQKGGHGTPKDCKALHRVAIIVAYRAREEQLRVLLHNLHSLLQKQQLDYSIFIVEQTANGTFNRAKLMNVGYVEALKLYPWECFIFHDVDLLPENDRNHYICSDQPRHMSVAMDKFDYKLPYSSYFGGVSALTVEQFQKINGFSNDYYGWGGEDDDLNTRVRLNNYTVVRYPNDIARYKMVKHGKDEGNHINDCRLKLMALTAKRHKIDGLSSLNYTIEQIELLPLYTHIVVDLLQEESKSFLEKINCR